MSAPALCRDVVCRVRLVVGLHRVGDWPAARGEARALEVPMRALRRSLGLGDDDLGAAWPDPGPLDVLADRVERLADELEQLVLAGYASAACSQYAALHAACADLVWFFASPAPVAPGNSPG